MYDATLSYPNAFYLGGTITIVGGLCYLPILLDKKLFKTENKEETNSTHLHRNQRSMSTHLTEDPETASNEPVL